MTSDVSEFFFVGSRLNMAYYVLLFQGLEPPKKVLKGENKSSYFRVKLKRIKFGL